MLSCISGDQSLKGSDEFGVPGRIGLFQVAEYGEHHLHDESLVRGHGWEVGYSDEEIGTSRNWAEFEL